MREGLDHWTFVAAAYAVGVIGTLALMAWAWMSMKRAEARRDAIKNSRGAKDK